MAAQERDGLAIAALVVGVGMAAVATLLPVIQVNGASGVVQMTTWQVLPWFTKLKILALAMLLAAAFLPQLHRWRLPLAAFAVIMVFVPSVSTFISAIYAWGEVRADLVRQAGTRNPFVHPGFGNVVLVAAGLLVTWSVWRLESRRGEAAAEGRAATA